MFEMIEGVDMRACDIFFKYKQSSKPFTIVSKYHWFS